MSYSAPVLTVIRYWNEAGDTALANDNTAVTDHDKANAFIVAIQLDEQKGPWTAVYRLDWRNVTQSGSFAALGSTGEMKYANVSGLTNGNAITSQTWTVNDPGGSFRNGEEIEDGVAGSFTFNDETFTELVFGVSGADGTDGEEYEFRVWDVTNGAEIGVGSATITLLLPGLDFTHTGNLQVTETVDGERSIVKVVSGALLETQTVDAPEPEFYPNVDNFNRTNADPIDGDWLYVDNGGSWPAISGNEVVNNNGSWGGYCYSTKESPFDDDQSSQVQLSGYAAITDDGGPMVRAGTGTASDAVYGYMYTAYTATTGRLYYFDSSGNGTNVGEKSISHAHGDVLRLQVIGTTFKLYKNGTLGGTWTHSGRTTGGAPGIAVFGTDGQFDNWKGGTAATFILNYTHQGALQETLTARAARLIDKVVPGNIQPSYAYASARAIEKVYAGNISTIMTALSDRVIEKIVAGAIAAEMTAGAERIIEKVVSGTLSTELSYEAVRVVEKIIQGGLSTEWTLAAERAVTKILAGAIAADYTLDSDWSFVAGGGGPLDFTHVGAISMEATAAAKRLIDKIISGQLSPEFYIGAGRVVEKIVQGSMGTELTMASLRIVEKIVEGALSVEYTLASQRSIEKVVAGLVQAEMTWESGWFGPNLDFTHVGGLSTEYIAAAGRVVEKIISGSISTEMIVSAARLIDKVVTGQLASELSLAGAKAFGKTYVGSISTEMTYSHEVYKNITLVFVGGLSAEGTVSHERSVVRVIPAGMAANFTVDSVVTSDLGWYWVLLPKPTLGGIWPGPGAITEVGTSGAKTVTTEPGAYTESIEPITWAPESDTSVVWTLVPGKTAILVAEDGAVTVVGTDGAKTVVGTMGAVTSLGSIDIWTRVDKPPGRDTREE